MLPSVYRDTGLTSHETRSKIVRPLDCHSRDVIETTHHQQISWCLCDFDSWLVSRSSRPGVPVTSRVDLANFYKTSAATSGILRA